MSAAKFSMKGRKLDAAWIAMAAAVILTAKGEFDLAVVAHFSPWIAWMFPVMLDVYVITAFARRRWKDMVVGMLLMIFCQVAVHVLPVFITEGEEVPWGLVVAVACVAPIVVVRVKILTGRTRQEIEADDEAARQTQEIRQARAETAQARRELAETQARAEAQTERAEAETAARTKAETQAAEAAAQAEIQTGKQAEILRQAQAEIQRLQGAVREAAEARDEARRHADAQTQAAGVAQGRLAEARDSAARAAAAQVAAEQEAAAHMQQVSATAEQAEHALRQQLAAATGAAGQADQRAQELTEQVRTLQAQLTEAREHGERQSTSRARTEQRLADLQAERDDALGELERVRTSAANEIERLQRQLARVSERPEIGSARQAEISRGSGRKSLTPVVAGLAGNLPVVETVAPETVATVLVAWAETPEATQAELHQRTGISDRTIRKVLRAIPAEIAGEVAGRVLALTDGRAA